MTDERRAVLEAPIEPRVGRRSSESTDATPDWERRVEEVLCSRCSYDLRGLTRPRCPECGLEFFWFDLLDPRRKPPHWLFEYHWRARPIRSWLGTTVRMLQPKRVWERRLSLHLPVRPAGLGVMLGASVVAPFVSLGTVLTIACGAAVVVDELIAREILPRPWNFGRGYFVSFIWMLRYLSRWSALYAAGLVGLALFEAGLLATLCGLRQTLARCRVRSVQMLRVVALTCASATTLLGVLIGLDLTLRGFQIPVMRAIPEETAVGAVLLYTIVTLRSGLAHYLRIPRATAVAIVATFVAGLFAFTGLFVAADLIHFR